MVEELFKNMHLQLSREDIRKIDEWKLSRGMKSRTEAIRAMIRIVTGINFDESSIVESFSEKNVNQYIKPENIRQKQNNNESLEDLIRKIVKEELSKILNDN